MSLEPVHPQAQSHIQPVVEQRVEIAHGTTLLKTRLLSNEKIVAEFIEKSLTTHRVNYSEVYKKNSCWFMPPSLRQVFLKDISEISVDNYRRVGESWLKKILNFLLRVVCPIAGIALIIYDSVANSGSDYYDYYGNFSSDHTKRWIGIVLLVVGIIAIILSLCRKKAPQVIFGTRCPQMPAFSITFTNASDRIRLLEEVTTLITKHQ